MAEVASDALDEIRRVAAHELQLPRAPEPQDDLLMDLHLDSVGLLTLVVALEDRFRIKLDEADAEQIRTVADLTALVARRAASQHQGEAAP
jgi:acyl carrier protein